MEVGSDDRRRLMIACPVLRGWALGSDKHSPRHKPKGESVEELNLE